MPLDELCDKMVMMSGFEVGDVEDLSATMDNGWWAASSNWKSIPMPTSCKSARSMWALRSPVQIVTGATNVFEGRAGARRAHDSRLPNGMHIKKASCGRCVQRHAVLRRRALPEGRAIIRRAEVYGILILKDGLTPGTDMREVLHLNDVVIDFKITANRPDCQSVLGVAREAAVALKKFPSAGARLRNQGAATSVSVCR